jgi:hypothetical protein
MAVYIGVVRPQKSKYLVTMNVISEILLLGIHVYSWVFLNPDLAESEAMQHGWIIVGCVGLYIAINWTIVIGFMIKNIFVNRKAKKI